MQGPGRHGRSLAGVVTALLIASALTLAGGPAAHAARPTLTVSDPRPIARETVTVRADLPGSGRRQIRLQRRAGSRWVTVATKRSDRRVAASFTRRVTTRTTFRAVSGSGRDRRTSRTVTVRPRTQSARLVVTNAAGSSRATATFVPARTRRTVVFQQQFGGAWRTVATTRQDARGRATATLRPTSSTRVRAVTAASRGAARFTSPTRWVEAAAAPSEPVPTPTPSPAPELRCELAPGGTVTWGHDDRTHRMREVARLDVTTEDGGPITSRTDYSRTSLVLTEPGADPVTLGARLRLRGNSTSWVSMKYPYKVKLDAKSSLRGMPASKDWVLLANFFDRSMLRNDTAFELARRLGADWTPRMQPVELWLNGTYRGLYQLGEGIEVEPDRVDLPPGAVLLEADSWEDTDPVFRTAKGLQVFVKKTDDADVAHAAQQVRRVEDVLYADHFAHPQYGYRACLDVPSFVDAYLIAEITKNIDAAFNNSVWMVLAEDGRLAMGPTWDHDQGLGNRRNCEIADPSGWFVNRRWVAEQHLTPRCLPTQVRGPEGHWYERLMSDPWFVDQVRARWREVHDSVAALPDAVDSAADRIAAAAGRNFAPVPEGGAGLPLGRSLLESDDTHVFHGSWPAEAAHLSTWLGDRIDWLDEQFGQRSTPSR